MDAGMSKTEASRTFRVARTTLDDWLALRAEQGHLLPKAHERRGPVPKISDLQAFEAFAVRHVGKTLAQMQSAWQEETGQRVSKERSRPRCVRSTGRVKKEFCVRRATEREASGAARGVLATGFARAPRETGVCGSVRVGQHPELCLGLESQGNTLSRREAWPPHPTGVGDGSPMSRAALCQGQLLAPLTFTGSCDAALVEAWFEQQLLPVLQEGQVVILDNASFHRHKTLRALLAQKNCSLLPLPPYSPDLNDIEHHWNPLKLRVAQDTNAYPCFHDKVDAAFV